MSRAYSLSSHHGFTEFTPAKYPLVTLSNSRRFADTTVTSLQSFGLNFFYQFLRSCTRFTDFLVHWLKGALNITSH